MINVSVLSNKGLIILKLNVIHVFIFCVFREVFWCSVHVETDIYMRPLHKDCNRDKLMCSEINFNFEKKKSYIWATCLNISYREYTEMGTTRYLSLDT